MTTHHYPPPVPAPAGSKPPCGCAGAEWVDPTNMLLGCIDCGRGMDPRYCCPGPPASTHWPAWHAERSRLEVLRVAAEVALAEAERLRRADQRRKDGGHEQSIEHQIRKQRAVVDAGGVYDPKSYPASRHKKADGAAVDEAKAALAAIELSIARLEHECIMCWSAWEAGRSRWFGAALFDPVYERARDADDAAREVCKRNRTPATYRAAVETDAACTLALLLAKERARLAENKA